MSNDSENTLVATLAGAAFAAYQDVVQLLQIPTYTYTIDWAETFQICWKAAIGALTGLIVKKCWDFISKIKRKPKYK